MSSEQPRGRWIGLRWTLLRAFLRELAFPTALAVAGFTLVVVIQDLLGYTDLVINRGLGLATVAWIAFYQTLPLAARTLPFALLVGALAGLGRLASDRELLALETSGLSPFELMAPVVVFSGVVFSLALGLSLGGAPIASRALDAMFEEISRERPGAAIRAGVVQRFGDWRLEVREASGRGDRMRGVQLWIPDVEETLFAVRGALQPGEGTSTEILLEQGSVLLSPRRNLRRIDFEKLTATLPSAERAIPRDPGAELAGARVAELRALAHDRSADPARVQRAAIELERRWALPAAAAILGLLALPLLLATGRFSRASGALLGILATVVYYGLVQLGDGLIEKGTLGVRVGAWLPNLVLGGVALLLAIRLRGLLTYGRAPARRLGIVSRLPRRRQARGIRTHRFVLIRWVTGRFAAAALLSFSTLLVAYLLVDVCARLEFFAQYSASGEAVLRYYAARLPMLASRVFPMSLLVAVALTVGLFSAQNELLGLRACGISGQRAMLPVLVACVLLAPIYFALDNKVVPQATALWHYVKNVEIRGREPKSAEPRAPAWYRIGNRLYEIEVFDPDHGSAQGITYYDLADDGLPRGRVDALAGRYVGNGVWRLDDPVRVEVVGGTLRRVAGEPFAELGTDLPAEVDTRELSVGELRREIRAVEASGYDATAYRVDFYAKLATPLACIVLPALALFFALAGPPCPNPAVMLLFSFGIALGYVLGGGVGQSLGYGGALPPVLAGTGATLLLLLLAIYLGWRVMAPGRGG
jgi:LPS export ABC transporter permease LptG